jgi:hypothetical protein
VHNVLFIITIEFISTLFFFFPSLSLSLSFFSFLHPLFTGSFFLNIVSLSLSLHLMAAGHGSTGGWVAHSGGVGWLAAAERRGVDAWSTAGRCSAMVSGELCGIHRGTSLQCPSFGVKATT